jgi:ribosome recycling factor
MQRIVTQLIRSSSPRFVVACPQRSSSLCLLSQTQRVVHLNRRNFANSPALHKKKDKAKRASASASDPEENTAVSFEDPFDLSQLHNGISTAVARLKDDLSKLRAGGRFNTTLLESLRVQLSKDTKDSVKLGDLAQVVPKGGRMVTLLAAEEDVSSSSSPSLLFCYSFVYPPRCCLLSHTNISNSC